MMRIFLEGLAIGQECVFSNDDSKSHIVFVIQYQLGTHAWEKISPNQKLGNLQ